MIIAAHLHLMIYDLYDSARFCASENFAQLQILRQWNRLLFHLSKQHELINMFKLSRLVGKLETATCLILQSAIMTSGYEISNFFKVTQKVLQTYVHRYFACSARLVQVVWHLGVTYDVFSGAVICNREIQGCLVLRNAHRILNLIHRHVQPIRRQEDESLKINSKQI